MAADTEPEEELNTYNFKTIYIDDSLNLDCIPFDVNEIIEQSNDDEIIVT
jgi:hypothetical protein